MADLPRLAYATGILIRFRSTKHPVVPGVGVSPVSALTRKIKDAIRIKRALRAEV